jgi:hypothetical protein
LNQGIKEGGKAENYHAGNINRGYKAGGDNPPTVKDPAGI